MAATNPQTTFSRIGQTERVQNVTASTLTVDEAGYEGQIITLNRAAGIAVTLPASTGNGASYMFILGTSVTSNSTTIKVANSSDIMTGFAFLMQDAGDTIVGFQTGSTDDTITMDGSTKGGLKGARVHLRDIAANTWHVEYISDASGTEATPFSATV